MASPSLPGLFDGLCRRLGLEPHEGRLLALMGALVATLMCAYTIAKVLRDALFIGEFGALFLPYAYIGVALASALFVWLEGRVASRFTGVGATRFNQYGAIAFGVLAALTLPVARHWTIVGFYLWTGSQAMMLLPHFWGLALNVWDSQRARRVFPALAGCGLLGGLAGGAISAWTTPLLQRVGLMWVMAALLVVAHGLTLVVERHRAQRPGPDEVPSTASRWEIIRRSRYIRVLAIGLALSVVVGTLVDFQFKYYIQHVYASPRALTAFLGMFYVVLNLVALLFQFGAAGWLMRRFGLGPASGLQPTSIVLLSAWVALSPAWWAILALRSVQGVISQSVGKAATEIYYVAIRPNERRLIKPAIDTLVERWSDALVGALLIVLLHTLHVRIPVIAVGTAVLAVVWVIVSLVLNREFGAAFETALSSRWLDPEEDSGAMQIAPARRTLLVALRSKDEARVVLALELGRGARDSRIARVVRDCLRHASPRVRLAAVRTMEAMRLRDREGLVAGFLADPDEALRRAATGYLVALGPRPAEFARRLLDGPDPAARHVMVDALFDHPYAALGVLTHRWIAARIEAGSREDLLLAARALGAMSGRIAAGQLCGLLANPDAEVRREALVSATRRPNPALLDALFPLLVTEELGNEARQALAASGDPAVPGLRRLLGGESGARAQELAARTLAHIASPRAIAALMTLVRSADVRLRYLGLRGLARMRVRTGQPVLPRYSSHRLFLRELHDYLHAVEPALALEADPRPGIRILGQSYREAAEMALERSLQALACWYDPRPLPGVFERLKSPRREAAAPALEYLGHVLPRAVFRPVRRLFEARGPGAPEDEATGPRLADRILRAWESGDEWLRACAVHASRLLPDFDSSLFSGGDGGSAMVREELDALAAPADTVPGTPPVPAKEPPC